MATKTEMPSMFFRTTCKGCGGKIVRGEMIYLIAPKMWVCGICAGKGKSAPVKPAAKEKTNKTPTITRTADAKFSSPCAHCKDPFTIGEEIHRYGPVWICDPCADIVKQGIKKEEPVKVQKKINPSKQQIAIFHEIKTTNNSIFVPSNAGTGKTTTELMAADYVDPKLNIRYLAFNRTIAATLKSRVPGYAKASTMHSMGSELIRRYLKVYRCNPGKVYQYLNTINSPDAVKTKKEKKAIKMTNFMASKLVSLAKAYVYDHTQFPELMERFHMFVNGDAPKIMELAHKALDYSRTPSESYDYDDMIWWPVIHNVRPKKLVDVLFIDEAQDLNQVQIQFAKNILSPSGRVIACGDPNQAIYAFRGADINAVNKIITEFNCVQLPLSVSYRCPRAVVALAQKFSSTIEAADDAPEGEVRHLSSEDEMTKETNLGDMVLCRTNAPMVSPVFDLMRRGVRAKINGQDFANEMKAIIDKISDEEDAIDVFLSNLAEYHEKEIERMKEKNGRASTSIINDKVETLIALSNGGKTVKDLIHNIDLIFADVDPDKADQWVTFSTVHKAKGLEADRVYIMCPDLMPFYLAESDWEKEQEKNIQYVAVTRAKKVLTIVGECNWV